MTTKLLEMLDTLAHTGVFDVFTHVKDYWCEKGGEHIEAYRPELYAREDVLSLVSDCLCVQGELLEEQMGNIVHLRARDPFTARKFELLSAQHEMLHIVIGFISEMLHEFPTKEEKVCTQKGSCVNSCVPTRIIGVFIV